MVGLLTEGDQSHLEEEIHGERLLRQLCLLSATHKDLVQYISYLYLANRYYGLVQFAFVIPLLTDALSPTQCLKLFRWQPVGAMITTLMCQFILGARVFVVSYLTFRFSCFGLTGLGLVAL